jgi:hypothetical protein
VATAIFGMGAGSIGIVTVGQDPKGGFDFNTITAAIAASSDGTVIEVYEGIYAEGPIDFDGKDLTLVGVNGPEATILEPAATGRVLEIDSVAIAVVEGFTIRNGSLVGTTSSGAGLSVQGSTDVVVRGCVFTNNAASRNGGGAFVSASSTAAFIGCTFNENSSELLSGGGLFMASNGGFTIDRCRFYGNHAAASGGGAFLIGGPLLPEAPDPRVTNSIFSGNHVTGALGTGGGLTIRLGLRSEKSGLVGYGGVYGCTFTVNSATAGGAVYGGHPSTPEDQVQVVNCILRDNVGDYAASTFPAPNWTRCALDFLDDASAEEAGNITADPRFVDPIGEDGNPATADDDLRLMPGSPCIDRGYTYSAPLDELNGDFDVDGTTRVLDDPLTPDDGVGGPPVVDIGAHEFDVEDIDGLDVAVWTDDGSGSDLLNPDNWYGEVVAEPGRTWLWDIGSDFVTPPNDGATIGSMVVGSGVVQFNPSSTGILVLAEDVSGLPLDDLTIGTFGEDARVSLGGSITLKCDDVLIGDRGLLYPSYSPIQVSGSVRIEGGEFSLRGGGLVSTLGGLDPSVLNLGDLALEPRGTGLQLTAQIHGDYAQTGTTTEGDEANGLLRVNLTDPVLPESLEVIGGATLAGGLDINTEMGTIEYQEGQVFTLLTATDGFNGTFFDFVVTRGDIVSEDLFFILTPGVDFVGGGEAANATVVSASSLLAGSSESQALGITLQDMMFADIDGDSFEDLVLSVDLGAGVPGEVVVMLNLGASAGTWDGFETFGGSTFAVLVGAQPRGLDVGFIDENGSLDVVVANYEDGTVSILTNSSVVGAVALTETLVLDSDPDFVDSSFPLDVCVQNLDLDAGGLSDILVTNERDGSVWAFQNTSSLQGTVFGNEQKSQPSLAIGRFTPKEGGSGRDDDTTGSSSDDDGVSSGSAGAGIGPGIFMTWTGYATPPGSAPLDLTVGDFNDDGFDDLATVNSGDNSISILLGNGAGYDPATTFALDEDYENPISVTAGDLDGDDDLDIVYICTRTAGPERVSRIMRNTLAPPSGSFGWVLEVEDDLSGEEPFLVRARDLDQDGTDEIVTLTEATSFAAGTTFGFAAPVAYPDDVCPGDFNDDGVVGGDDLARILGSWGTNDPEIELSGDEIIDGTDLAIILGEWGACSGGGAFD